MKAKEIVIQIDEAKFCCDTDLWIREINRAMLKESIQRSKNELKFSDNAFIRALAISRIIRAE